MGEKRTNNPERSRAQILNSAQHLFIQNGYDGTSMRAIAKHSGVTQSMIHHYFGSKAELWNAIKKHAYDEYLAHQQQIIDQDDGDVLHFIQTSLHSRFQFFQENPQVARLLSWLQINQDPTGMETGQEIGRQILGKIRQAQTNGGIRDDIEPESILAISLALTTHWFQSRHVIMNFAGLTDTSLEAVEKLDDQYLDAIIKVFVEGLHAGR